MDICLDHLDLETRSLAVKILRQDIKEAMENMKGKQGQFDYDSKVALDAYLADLEAQAALSWDRAMAQSMVQAVHQDESIIAAAVAQEEQAANDRRAALQLHRRGHLPKHPEPSKSDDNAIIDDELRTKLEAGYNLISREDDKGNDHDYPRRPAKFRPCAICTENTPFHDLARLACSHEYCRGCLKHVFTLSLTDEVVYPPRCCKQLIPETETQIQIFLGGELLGKFLARKLEMETPNRTYCHRRDCTTFIPPQGIQGDIGICPKCHCSTCCICKEAAHQGFDCPQDESAQHLLEMAAREGWKQCFGCGRMVELGYGCNHISKSSWTSSHVASHQTLTALSQPADAELTSVTYAARPGKRWESQESVGALCLTRTCLPSRPHRKPLKTQHSTSSPR